MFTTITSIVRPLLAISGGVAVLYDAGRVWLLGAVAAQANLALQEQKVLGAGYCCLMMDTGPLSFDLSRRTLLLFTTSTSARC